MFRNNSYNTNPIGNYQMGNGQNQNQLRNSHNASANQNYYSLNTEGNGA